MKKVIYILNLLFLTLSVFGGSVFAAQPDFYLSKSGQPVPIPNGIQHLTNIGTIGNGTETYYVDSALTTGGITIAENSDVRIIVAGGVQLYNKNYITVPSTSSVTFNAACDQNGTLLPNSYLYITHNTAGYIIGNQTNSTPGDGTFGDIIFESGTYNIYNSANNATYPAIGSRNESGGEIVVNQFAKVYATSASNGISVGVAESTDSCTITIDGGVLSNVYPGNNAPGSDANSITGTPGGSIQAGKGTLTLNNQGYLAYSYNESTAENVFNNFEFNSGIVAINPTGATWAENPSPWNATVYGEVALPTASGLDLSTPVPGMGKKLLYFNSVTVDEDAVLTFGAKNPAEILMPGVLSISTSNLKPVPPGEAVFNNSGTVNINSLQYGGGSNNYYPATWNNNSGSVLTVADGQTLKIYNNFVNAAATSSKPAGEITFNGTLTILNPNGNQGVQNDGNFILNGTVYFTGTANFQNSGTLDINLTGDINGSLVNDEDGTVNLDGTVNAGTGNVQNSGALDIGPIGTVSGGASVNLVNEEGGTVTSQNPVG